MVGTWPELWPGVKDAPGRTNRVSMLTFLWYKEWIEERAGPLNTDEHPSATSVPTENPNPDERDVMNNDQDNKGAINGFMNVIIVLSIVTVLTYLFN